MLDLLVEGDLRIVGAMQTRIEHSLVALPGATLAGIRNVFSHPTALAQCAKFFRNHFHFTAISH